eukprot:1517696-Pleurochrysis_carterae.AAC.1
MKGCVSYADSLSPLRGIRSGGDAGGAARALAHSHEEPLAHARTQPHAHSHAPECFWALPVLCVVPADDEAETVERYLALIAELAAGRTPSTGESTAGLAVSALLRETDEQLSEHLEQSLEGGASAVDEIVSDARERLCVGWLEQKATLFAWDICLLSGWKNITRVIAAALLCLRDGLFACANADDTAAYLIEHAKTLSVSQLRAALEAHFMPALRQEVNAPRPDDSPELAPSELTR